MKLIQENYLDQMSEDLELINFKLDRLFEASIIPPAEGVDSDDFSLLESIDAANESAYSFDPEKYELYSEALNDSLKAIWKAVIRFVKSVFVSSGKKISTEDAKKIVEILSDTESEELKGTRMKLMVQKGFYLIAGLGTSVDGQSLKRAYDSGDIVSFVTSNINKVKVDKLPSGSTFRICVATFDANIKNSMALMTEVLNVLAAKGINGLKDLGNSAKGKASKSKDKEMKESLDEIDIAEQVLMTENIEDGTSDSGEVGGKPTRKSSANKAPSSGSTQNEISGSINNVTQQVNDFLKSNPSVNSIYYKIYKSDTKIEAAIDSGDNIQVVAGHLARINKNLMTLAKKINDDRDVNPTTAANIRDQVSKLEAQVNSLTKSTAHIRDAAVAGIAISAIAIALVKISQNAKSKAKGKNDHIDMATITYVDETKDSAMAKVRLYSGLVSKSIDVRGKEKVSQLRNDLIAVAEEMQTRGDNLGAGVREHVLDVAQNIMVMFSGLASKGE